MYTKHINNIHVEVTDRCNAECPVCPRSQSGGETFPYVKDHELSVEYFKLIGYEFLSQIEFWNFCGVKGDPASAQDLFEIFDYILECNPDTEIVVRTNGGARNEKFWSRIGQLFKDTNCRIIWSVDGWEDTNHIYRKNVKWTKLYNNMMSYIETGAKSLWDFNIFAHNEKDIPIIKKFCHQYDIEFRQREPFGFKRVERNPKYDKEEDAVSRLNNNNLVDIKTIPVYEKTGDGLTSKLAYTIKPAGIPEDRILDTHPNITSVKNYIPSVYDINAYTSLKGTKEIVACQSLRGQSQEIYLDSNGMIFPCCYTAGKFHMGDEQLNSMYRPYKKNLKVTESNTIYDVLNLDLFKKVMPDGMKGSLDDNIGYCVTCVQHCKAF